MAKFAGANQVTFTSAAPPVRYPHVYGINMPNTKELIAHDKSITDIAVTLSIDQMVYQEIDDLKHAILCDSNITGLDMCCFTGEYVTGNITEEYLDWVESKYSS